MPRRVDPALVKAAFELQGYTLLSEYVRAKDKIPFECPNGHRHSMSWHLFSKGRRCGVCAGKAIDTDFVSKAFADEGYTLLGEYKNAKAKLPFICPSGHRHSVTWNSWKNGARCGLCAVNAPLTHADVEAAFNAEGYELLSVYSNSKTPVNFKCPNGHNHSITWDSWRNGARCGVCAQNMKYTHAEVEPSFSAEGYTLLEQYTGVKNLMLCECPEGHQYRTNWQRWRDCHRCPECNGGGFNPARPAILYYLKIVVDTCHLYKIGITNNSVKTRYSNDPVDYTILMETPYLFGFLAYEKEQQILSKYSRWQYNGPKILIAGNTELFTRDVLGLDKCLRNSQIQIDQAI